MRGGIAQTRDRKGLVMSDACCSPSDAAIAQAIREQRQRGYYTGAIDCINERAREIDALRIATHADDCHSWGPRHYECAARKIAELQAQVDGLKHEIGDLHMTLKQREDFIGTKQMDCLIAIKDREKAEAALAECREDANRLDWLADKENSIGDVMLPTECVEKNPHSLRAAIDAARAK